MRYDLPPYPCPGCGQPRLISTPEECGSGQPVAYCPNCPAQDARGNPVGVLVISWSDAVREVLRRAGRPVCEDLDSLAGLVPRESREGLGVEIQECWREQTRHRGGSGGSNSKGRKKDQKGGGKWLGGNDDNRTGAEGDLARTSKRKSRLTSSVHSARLDGARRRKLQALAAAQGVTESEAIGAAIEIAHAIEQARPTQSSQP